MYFEWTSERMNQLAQLASEDMTASQIAGEMGEGLTRNAVIGKLNRMGMKTGHAIYHPKDRAKRARPAWRFRPRDRAPEPVLEPVELPVDLPPNQSPHAVQFCKTQEHHCRWPLDEEPSADMLVCGAVKLKGLPYCPRHARIAYTNGRG